MMLYVSRRRRGHGRRAALHRHVVRQPHACAPVQFPQLRYDPRSIAARFRRRQRFRCAHSAVRDLGQRDPTIVKTLSPIRFSAGRWGYIW